MCEWKKRKAITEAFPSNLTFIAGRKNDVSVVKFFLKDDDHKVQANIEEQAKRIGIKAEIAYASKLKKKSESLKETTEDKKLPPSMNETDRKRLGNIINNTGEKLMALYSNITWISIGNMPKGPHFKPCIVLHCLDKLSVSSIW